MNYDEHLCAVALSLCPGVGAVSAKRLVEAAGSAADVFRRRTELAGAIPGLRAGVLQSLDSPATLAAAERELEFARRHGISCFSLADEAYPYRLKECPDAPVVLFWRGNADLNCRRVVALVGTRRATDYGKQFCAAFVAELARLCPGTLVVSGLAYGIDISAHRAALAGGLSTVGVLAHGLDRIYPSAHRKTAAEMLSAGGLITEFTTGTEPDRYNFVSRNRIIAGLSDAVVVVESAARGGALITADLATDYNRQCFALPGRVGDLASEGCNRLIAGHKAQLLTGAIDLVAAMNWDVQPAKGQSVQRGLFDELPADEAAVVRLLSRRGDLHINTLVVETDIPVQRMSALLFEMEMKGLVKALVGGAYHLLG